MLKQAHEIEFIKGSPIAKSPLDHERDMKRVFEENNVNPVIVGYVMPWNGVYTKVVLDYGFGIVEERTIHHVKRGIENAVQKLTLRRELKEAITKSLKAVSDDLEFVEFMPKTKNSHHIHYKARNAITGKSKIYVARKHDKESFVSILTPQHLKRDTSLDGTLAFAKDIPFVKYHNKSKTPEEAEQLVLERCKDINATFNGFILPFTRYFDAKISITINETGETKTLCAKGFVEGTISGLGRTRARVNSGYMNDGHPTWFYLVKLGDSHIKYGISCDVERRFKEHKRNCTLPITLLESYFFEDGYYANLMEEEVAKRFTTNVISKKVFKSGYSETLDITDLNSLYEFIDDFMKDKGEKDYMGWLSPKDKFNEDTFEIETHFYGEYIPYGWAA
ncbi:TPA: hypothetical protein ACISXB_003338 [Salmonella enterica subsp. enterica serovar Javiana]